MLTFSSCHIFHEDFLAPLPGLCPPVQCLPTAQGTGPSHQVQRTYLCPCAVYPEGRGTCLPPISLCLIQARHTAPTVFVNQPTLADAWTPWYPQLNHPHCLLGPRLGISEKPLLLKNPESPQGQPGTVLDSCLIGLEETKRRASLTLATTRGKITPRQSLHRKMAEGEGGSPEWGGSLSVSQRS